MQEGLNRMRQLAVDLNLPIVVHGEPPPPMIAADVNSFRLSSPPHTQAHTRTCLLAALVTSCMCAVCAASTRRARAPHDLHRVHGLGQVLGQSVSLQWPPRRRHLMMHLQDSDEAVGPATMPPTTPTAQQALLQARFSSVTPLRLEPAAAAASPAAATTIPPAAAAAAVGPGKELMHRNSRALVYGLQPGAVQVQACHFAAGGLSVCAEHVGL